MTNGRNVERLHRDAGVPTLVPQGGRDRIVPPAAVAAFASRRPDWTFRHLDDLGHSLQLEDPRPFVTEVVEWLDGPGTRARDRAGHAQPGGADRPTPAQIDQPRPSQYRGRSSVFRILPVAPIGSPATISSDRGFL